jgi:hypothetical protein
MEAQLSPMRCWTNHCVDTWTGGGNVVETGNLSRNVADLIWATSDLAYGPPKKNFTEHENDPDN